MSPSTQSSIRKVKNTLYTNVIFNITLDEFIHEIRKMKI